MSKEVDWKSLYATCVQDLVNVGEALGVDPEDADPPAILNAAKALYFDRAQERHRADMESERVNYFREAEDRANARAEAKDDELQQLQAELEESDRALAQKDCEITDLKALVESLEVFRASVYESLGAGEGVEGVDA